MKKSSDASSIHIGHGTWIPGGGAEFDNSGKFFFWIETSVIPKMKIKRKASFHPHHLADPDDLYKFLSAGLLLSNSMIARLEPQAATYWLFLPSHEKKPLPSIALAQMFHASLQDDAQDLTWHCWEIQGVCVSRPMLFLKELDYINTFQRPDLFLGHDIWFWIRYSRALGDIVRRHHFLPVMKCRHPGDESAPPQIHSSWAPAAQQYESNLREFARAMPGICRISHHEKKPKRPEVVQPPCLAPVGLLRHFSEQQTNQLVTDAMVTKTTLNQFKGQWPQEALRGPMCFSTLAEHELTMDDWRGWRAWHQSILGRQGPFLEHDGAEQMGFVLGIRLSQVDDETDDALQLTFFVSAVQDPSLQINLEEWWAQSEEQQTSWLKHFGQQFERNLLVYLGHAARICPLLWQAMETPQPIGIDIDINTAYEFLKNDALVLESAGFRVLLPSWWTPKGRQRARLRVNASSKSGTVSSAEISSGYFSFDKVVEFSYEFAVGQHLVSEDEWRQLVNAKTPLVRFRGEWMELDREQMGRMLELVHGQEQGLTTFSSMLKEIAEADTETTEYVFDRVLDDILRRLQQKEAIQPLEDPANLNGTLRAYQKIGVSWLTTMESLGLNPCLADDMGLGKTIQVIALVLHERATAATGEKSAPAITLLIAPTSVMGNWQREIWKFAPQLKCMLHHGSDRIMEAGKLKKACARNDFLITSFSIARRDSALLKQQQWGRIVVDEAQNIKNPKSAQAKAICALEAPHRIALTGTPIENRLMDLWSLFHFLNPGFLGNETQFRKAYEMPIQRHGDQARTRQLQKLVHPFILRRMKTDPAIISDLPDKVEQKIYCNLTQEQASLYQAVVDDVLKQLEEADGMQRRGMILATLMKLKQICNHPAQFLQDASPFTETRSQKLERLNGMIEEALEEKSSMLVFTQFTEIGIELERFVRDRHRCPVHYLHGGTNRGQRQRMIENFQNPTTPAGIFILSLKAGGVGITLTRANHVFHFDRWWNPAVENQATDRAYRIGQKKTVFVHKMVTLGTLEEKIDAMIEDKKALAENIVGADENWITEMDNEQFGQLISLNRQAIMEAA